MSTAPALDPAEFFASQLHLVDSVIERVCRGHHLSAADAEEFGSIVRLKLIENDYRILRTFQGRADLQSFLFVVVERLLIDYRRQQWGKWRASAGAKRLGPVAVLLELLLIRDGLTFGEACEILRTNHGVTLTDRELSALLAQLPVRTRRRMVTDEAILEHQTAPPVVDRYEQSEEEGRLVGALERAMGKLTPRERLVIKLRFYDGLSIADIARGHGFEAKALYREIKALLRQLRRDLEADGISSADVGRWLGPAENEVSCFENPPVEPEGGAGSPSL